MSIQTTRYDGPSIVPKSAGRTPPKGPERKNRRCLTRFVFADIDLAGQGEGRGEGGHPARPAAPDLLGQADVSSTPSLPLLPCWVMATA